MAKTIATIIADLKIRRDRIVDRLSAMDAQSATYSEQEGDLPNNTGPNAVDHVGKNRRLYEELMDMQAAIDAMEETASDAEGGANFYEMTVG